MNPETIVDMLLFTAGAMALLSGAMSAGRTPAAAFPHVLLLGLVSAGSLGLFFAHGREPWAVGLALSGFGAFTVAPGLLLALARRLALRDRFRAAGDLLILRFPLAPSPASWLEVRVVQAFDAASRGRFGEAFAALEALRDSRWIRPVRARLDDAALDLCLREFRWAEALAWKDHDPAAFEASARRVPRLWVRALHALCETDRLAEAGQLLSRLAAMPPSRFPPDHLAGAYMIALACAGEVEKLETLFGGFAAYFDHVPAAVREAWIGRANGVRGNRELAQVHFLNASVMASAANPGLLRRILRLSEAPDAPAEGPGMETAPWPPPLPPPAVTMSPRAFASPRLQNAPATLGLLAVSLAALGALRFAGRGGDSFALCALGANVDFLVSAGETWRLGSSIFLHADEVHFFFNALGLLVLGNLLENLYGTSRFLVLYAVSGFAGSALSHFVSHPILSVGASGAIMGLVGAGIAFLLVRGSALPAQARRTLLFLFLFVAAADSAFGFAVEQIDNFAHLGGLLAGFLAGALTRPALLGPVPGPWRKARVLAVGLASAGLLAACAAIAVHHFLSGAPIPEGIEFRSVKGPGDALTLEVPAHWLEIEEGETKAKFGGPFLDAFVVALPAEPSDLGRAALQAEEEEWRSRPERRPLIGPKAFRAPDGREFLQFLGFGEGGEERRSFTIAEDGLVVRILFLGPHEALEAHAAVIGRVLSSLRISRERAG